MPKDIPEVVKLFCNSCGRETRHDLLASIRQEDSDDLPPEGYGVSWVDIYQTLQCRGCGHVTYRSRFWFSEYQEEDRPSIYEDRYYPPLMSHPKPKWFDDLNNDLRQVLDEVYTALHHKLNYLTAVGARTALDMMIVEKIGDIGTFQQKVDSLEKQGYITLQERDLIEAVTEAGNAAAHRGYSPDAKNLQDVINILEALLHKFYILESESKRLIERAQKVKVSVPPRKKKV